MSGSLFQWSFQPATILEKRPQHRCFPVKFVKVLRTYNLQNKKSWSNSKKEGHCPDAFFGSYTSKSIWKHKRKCRTRLLVAFSQYENLNRNDRLKRVGLTPFLEGKVKLRRLIFSFFELLRFCIFLSLTVAEWLNARALDS